MADDDHRAPAKPCQAADDRLVVAIGAITGERREVLEQSFDIMAEMGSFRMACDLGLLPGRELCIGLSEQLVRAFFELFDLVGKIDIAAFCQVLEFFDLAFQLADRFFEV